MTDPIPKEAFKWNANKRPVLVSITARRSLFSDEQWKILRAGFPPPTAEFYHGNTAGSLDYKAPIFSAPAVVRGFNMTYGDFHIVQRCIIMMIRIQNLHSVDNLDSVYAQTLAEPIIDELERHPIIKKEPGSGEFVPTYWRRHMLARWITKTARWVGKCLDKDPAAFDIGRAKWPSTSPEHGAKKWNPKAGPTEPNIPVRDIHISLHICTDPGELDPTLNTAITMAQISYEPDHTTVRSHASGEWKEYAFMSFALLKEQIPRVWPNAHDPENEGWIVAYYNPYWGNEAVEITEDLELWVAVHDLRVRDRHSISLQVFLREEDDEEFADRDIVSDDEGEDEDGDNMSIG